MARMIPARPVNTKSRAEIRFFERLRDALPPEYTVLHSVRWLEPPGRSKPLEGECDFLIAHPSRGALLIEVKGGLIAFDAASGEWFSQDRAGNMHGIKDPYSQARDNCYSLLGVLRSTPGMPRNVGPIGWAVAFPDGVVQGPQAPSMPKDLTIDGATIESDRFTGRIEQLFARWRGGQQAVMGAEAVRKIVEVLSLDLTMRSPLGVEVAEADRAILELSQTQLALLDLMRKCRRVDVAGCAGSGKTVLATHRAVQLAQQGFETLLTCFNQPLAEHLRQSIGRIEHLSVMTFHQLCRRRAGEAGISLQWPIGDEARHFFEVDMPEALMRSVDRLGPAFDAIVVDEGQDFAESWWDPLVFMLRDPIAGVLFVFYDDNQALYRRPQSLPTGLVPFEMHQNWRNTAEICAKVAQYYEGEIKAMGPSGPTVEILQAAHFEEARDELRRVLHRLIKEEGIASKDIVVLTPHAVEKSGLRGRLGGFLLVEHPNATGEVRLSSIHLFKGLEARVAIVVGNQAGHGYAQRMYVACSRARALLVVIEIAPNSRAL